MEENMVNEHFMAEEELLSEQDFKLLFDLGLNPPRGDSIPDKPACSWRAIVKRPESEIPFEFRKSVLVPHHNATVASSGVLSKFTIASVRPRQPGIWPSHTTYEPITIAELQANVVHRGRVLYGTLCAESFQTNCIGNVLEDHAGYAVSISVYNCNTKFPCGLKLAIKEPFFKIDYNRQKSVRVDDAGSIDVVKELPAPPTPQLEPLNKLKLQGNRFFGLEFWNRSIGLYTECIKGCEAFSKTRWDEKMRKDILLPALSNRGEAYLKLSKFERALVDSNKALRIDPDHFESLFRKGRALDGLQEFDRAIFWLRQSLAAATGGWSDIEPVIEISKARSEQGKMGVYNISEFLMQRTYPPRCSDFVGPVKLGAPRAMDSGRQLALFAVRDIKRGELLLVNEAVASFPSSNDTEFRISLPTTPVEAKRHELVDLVLSKLADSRRAASQLKILLTLGPEEATDLNVFRSSKGIVPEYTTDVAEMSPKELSRKVVKNLVAKHGFETWMPYMVSDTGLWVLPSLLSHSCISNTSLLQVGAAMFVHAARDIRKNEELTVAYCDTLLPLHKRQEQYETWGFNCKCKRCTLEQSLRKQLGPLNDSFNRSFGDPYELASLGPEVEKCLLLLSSLKLEEKHWVRAAYMLVFIAGIQSMTYLSSVRNRSMSVEEILEVVQAVVPGHIRSVRLLSCQVAALMRYGTKEQMKLIQQKDVKNVFKSALGNQDPPVIMHVVSVCSEIFKL